MVVLVGTGGHAKVVFEALCAGGIAPDVIYPRDGRVECAGQLFMGRMIAHPELPTNLAGVEIHVAIGSSAVRSRFLTQATNAGAIGRSVLHPAAHISPTSDIGFGSFVACGAVIASFARIDQGTIVNHNAVVDHDCRIGAFCHIAPGAVLGGQVNIGNRVLIGAGSVVLPGVVIGSDVTVGAGSVVMKSIADGETWIGTRSVS